MRKLSEPGKTQKEESLDRPTYTNALLLGWLHASREIQLSQYVGSCVVHSAEKYAHAYSPSVATDAAASRDIFGHGLTWCFPERRVRENYPSRIVPNNLSTTLATNEHGDNN